MDQGYSEVIKGKKVAPFLFLTVVAIEKGAFWLAYL